MKSEGTPPEECFECDGSTWGRRTLFPGGLPIGVGITVPCLFVGWKCEDCGNVEQDDTVGVVLVPGGKMEEAA